MKLKSLKEKKFITIGEKRSIPYGLGMIKDFHYGDWLCLVEGEKDRDTMAQIYPNVVATSTAGAGSVMREVLMKVTNRFICFYDNDDSGDAAFFRDRKRFVNCQFIRGEHPRDCKDVGTISDLLFKGDSFNSEYLTTFYKMQIDGILG